MVTRDEFTSRIDALQAGLDRQFDRVLANQDATSRTLVEHSNRLTALEVTTTQAPLKPTTGRWAMAGTGIGAAVTYALQYLLSKGDVK